MGYQVFYTVALGGLQVEVWACLNESPMTRQNKNKSTSTASGPGEQKSIPSPPPQPPRRPILPLERERGGGRARWASSRAHLSITNLRALSRAQPNHPRPNLFIFYDPTLKLKKEKIYIVKVDSRRAVLFLFSSAAVCLRPSPLKPTTDFQSLTLLNHSKPKPPPPLLRRNNFSLPTITSAEPQPLFSSVRSFAPATIANLGPGFDFLGCAVDGLGDYVSLRVDPSVHPGEISISDISGIHSSHKLSKDPLLNCAGIAAIAAMKMLNIRSVGLSLSLEKALPLASGLGSSAASAAAAVVAVNELFGTILDVNHLVLAGLESEAKVSGYHADNIAPAIMGGFVLIRSYDPLELMSLKFPADKEVFFVLVSPDFEAPTKKMRAVLPAEIGMPHHVWNCSQAATLVASVLQGDLVSLGEALASDKIVEPKRAPLIPGMEGVKKVAIEAGAFGCTISGAGPTAVAVTDDEERGKEIVERMVETFLKDGNLNAVAMVKRLDRLGARLVGDPLPFS